MVSAICVTHSGVSPARISLPARAGTRCFLIITTATVMAAAAHATTMVINRDAS